MESIMDLTICSPPSLVRGIPHKYCSCSHYSSRPLFYCTQKKKQQLYSIFQLRIKVSFFSTTKLWLINAYPQNSQRLSHKLRSFPLLLSFTSLVPEQTTAPQAVGERESYSSRERLADSRFWSQMTCSTFPQMPTRAF